MKSHAGFIDIDERHASLSKTGDAARSKVRSAVEHVFAAEKHRLKLLVRTVVMARLVLLQGRAALACAQRQPQRKIRIAWQNH